MGHKVHPIGLRLGIHRKWKSNWYFDSKNFTKFLYLNFDIEKYFKGIFFFYPIRTILINCQIIKMPSNEIFVFIFYYRLRRKKYKIKNTAWKMKRWRYAVLEKPLVENTREDAVLEYRIASSRKAKLEKIINIISKNNWNNINKNYIVTGISENNYNLKLKHYFDKLMFLKNYISIWSSVIKLKNKKKIKLFLTKLKFKIKLLKKSVILLYFLIIKLKLKFNPMLNLYLKNLISKYNVKLNHYNKFNYISYFYKNNDIFSKYYVKFFKNYCKKSTKLLDKKKKRAYKKLKLKKIYRLLLIKRKLKESDVLKWKKKTSKLIFYKKIKYSIKNAKKFLSKITNCKIHVIFINSLSFCKFVCFTNKKNTDKNLYNMWPLQRYFFNRYKYTAIYVKDFIHLAFITIFLKNPQVLVNFIGKQFEDLPRNRRQIRLLVFISHAIKVICAQRPEIIGIQFQIKGRLNRRTRTKVYKFREGILAIQSTKSRVEYGYSKGWTKRGLIGIKFWIFYKQDFNQRFKKKFLEYFLYSKYRLHFNFKFFLKQFYFWMFKKKQSKRTIMLQKRHNTTPERAYIIEKFTKLFKVKSVNEIFENWKKFVIANNIPSPSSTPDEEPIQPTPTPQQTTIQKKKNPNYYKNNYYKPYYRKTNIISKNVDSKNVDSNGINTNVDQKKHNKNQLNQQNIKNNKQKNNKNIKNPVQEKTQQNNTKKNIKKNSQYLRNKENPLNIDLDNLNKNI